MCDDEYSGEDDLVFIDENADEIETCHELDLDTVNMLLDHGRRANIRILCKRSVLSEYTEIEIPIRVVKRDFGYEFIYGYNDRVYVHDFVIRVHDDW